MGPYNRYDWYIAAPLIGLSTLVSLWNKISWNFILNPLILKNLFSSLWISLFEKNEEFIFNILPYVDFNSTSLIGMWFYFKLSKSKSNEKRTYLRLTCTDSDLYWSWPLWILGQNDFWILGQNYKVQGFSDNVLTQYVASAWN